MLSTNDFNIWLSKINSLFYKDFKTKVLPFKAMIIILTVKCIVIVSFFNFIWCYFTEDLGNQIALEKQNRQNRYCTLWLFKSFQCTAAFHFKIYIFQFFKMSELMLNHSNSKNFRICYYYSLSLIFLIISRNKQCS